LCQGQADLPERAEYDDELDCPGELAGDEYVESSGTSVEPHFIRAALISQYMTD